MRTTAIVRAKMGSKGLSGHSMADLAGGPLAWRFPEGAKRCRGLDCQNFFGPAEPESREGKWLSEYRWDAWPRKNEYKDAVLPPVSDASSYMTGSAMVINGGRSCW